MKEMSTSEDSDDEQVKQILEAADTGFLNNELFQVSSKDESNTTRKSAPRSERYLDASDDVHFRDLHVPEKMQEFVGRKLSEIIERKCRFVSPSELELQVPKTKRPKNRVKLLSDCDTPIDLSSENSLETSPKIRPKIKKRIVESDAYTNSEKVQLAAVDSGLIQSEIESWRQQSKPDKLFQYKAGKDGTFHFVEPENEFSKLRKKNCWSEKRIARKSTARKVK